MCNVTGKDKYVVLWSIHDHISTLSGESTDTKESIVKTADNASLGPRGIFQGHTDTVEDVQFCPTRFVLLYLCIYASRSLLKYLHF